LDLNIVFSRSFIDQQYTTIQQQYYLQMALAGCRTASTNYRQSTTSLLFNTSRLPTIFCKIYLFHLLCWSYPRMWNTTFNKNQSSAVAAARRTALSSAATPSSAKRASAFTPADTANRASAVTQADTATPSANHTSTVTQVHRLPMHLYATSL
jgi:hypothetical protein